MGNIGSSWRCPFWNLPRSLQLLRHIGFGWALSLILAGSLCGALLILRHAGGGHMARIRVALDHGSLQPCRQTPGAAPSLLAGILLLIPGFITDIVALVLLVAMRCVGAFVGAAPRQEDRVVDLAPEQWHQVPDPSLPDHRKTIELSRHGWLKICGRKTIPSLFPHGPYVSQPPRALGRGAKERL